MLGMTPSEPGLEHTALSPSVALGSLGATSLGDRSSMLSAQELAAEERRQVRRKQGIVPFSPERNMPDVGGLGWRTKTGHLLKNQAYYSQKSRVNMWDRPLHAGVNSWKAWHGPRLRSDADTMERLDLQEQQQERWEAQRSFVKASRAESMERLQNRKLERARLENAESWSPQRQLPKQVHSHHETFDGCIDEKSGKELKKTFTRTILQRDREAVRTIAASVQREETWKMLLTQLEQERRAHIRADLHARELHTDSLMSLSGQPARPQGVPLQSLSNCSIRSSELAQPKVPPRPLDVTSLTDFAGLVHSAANAHVLEEIFPGSGHAMSKEFRVRATRSTEPGWPPPAAAETPRMSKRAVQPAASAGGSNSAPELLTKPRVQFHATALPPDEQPGASPSKGGRRATKRAVSDGASVRSNESDAAVKAVCRELDEWEATTGSNTVPQLSNFFQMPRASLAVRSRSLGRTTSRAASGPN